jgi:hypothetical protein
LRTEWNYELLETQGNKKKPIWTMENSETATESGTCLFSPDGDWRFVFPCINLSLVRGSVRGVLVEPKPGALLSILLASETTEMP